MNVNVCILMLFKIEEGSRFWCKANLKKNMGFIWHCFMSLDLKSGTDRASSEKC